MGLTPTLAAPYRIATDTGKIFKRRYDPYSKIVLLHEFLHSFVELTLAHRSPAYAAFYDYLKVIGDLDFLIDEARLKLAGNVNAFGKPQPPHPALAFFPQFPDDREEMERTLEDLVQAKIRATEDLPPAMSKMMKSRGFEIIRHDLQEFLVDLASIVFFGTNEPFKIISDSYRVADGPQKTLSISFSARGFFPPAHNDAGFTNGDLGAEGVKQSQHLQFVKGHQDLPLLAPTYQFVGSFLREGRVWSEMGRMLVSTALEVVISEVERYLTLEEAAVKNLTSAEINSALIEKLDKKFKAIRVEPCHRILDHSNVSEFQWQLGF